jgi:peptidoglycan/LPS O-acetylase OafA/YrhL
MKEPLRRDEDCKAKPVCQDGAGCPERPEPSGAAALQKAVTQIAHEVMAWVGEEHGHTDEHGRTWIQADSGAQCELLNNLLPRLNSYITAACRYNIQIVPMEIKYRADIDGLRAIAVLAVLLFHTDVPGFTGGFVGVDVFFVISGYLITSIILKEIKAEQFSIARFYERRIRRIFPALFPVIAFVLVVGAYLFDANAFKDLGQSIAATILFSSNILFWRESGYFAAPSLQKPLLHTWSLAVEEQFYIFFPLALMAIHRYLKGKYFLWVVIAFIFSLVASIYGVVYHPGAAFYLVPTRAWELMVGSILALGVLPDLSKNWQRNTLTLSGLALILFSIVAYTEATPFPGIAALAPVMGSGLII